MANSEDSISRDGDDDNGAMGEVERRAALASICFALQFVAVLPYPPFPRRITGDNDVDNTTWCERPAVRESGVLPTGPLALVSRSRGRITRWHGSRALFAIYSASSMKKNICIHIHNDLVDESSKFYATNFTPVTGAQNQMFSSFLGYEYAHIFSGYSSVFLASSNPPRNPALLRCIELSIISIKRPTRVQRSLSPRILSSSSPTAADIPSLTRPLTRSLSR